MERSFCFKASGIALVVGLFPPEGIGSLPYKNQPAAPVL
jgi:hypothetical protein